VCARERERVGLVTVRRRRSRLLEAPIPPPDLPPGRTVVVPDRGEVFVRDSGPAPGPTILLCHGWTVSADLNWWPAYRPLGEVGRVIAIDHRGHGRGMRSEQPFSLEAAADDAAGALRALGVSSAIVVGYSMGGPVSMLLTQRHPDLVEGLVCQATALEWRASRRERWIWRTIGVMEWFLRLGNVASLAERALREAPPEHQPWFRAEITRGDPADITNAGRALGQYDARPFAASLGVPAVVVVTTKDRLVRPKKQRALAAALGAQTIELQGDHDVPWLQGPAFASATVQAVQAVLDAGRLRRSA
jgi:3-oxoadipate enol-lactonase